MLEISTSLVSPPLSVTEPLSLDELRYSGLPSSLDQPPCLCPLLFAFATFSFACHQKSAPQLPGFHSCEKYFKIVQ